MSPTVQLKLPIIDLGTLDAASTQMALHQACTEWGAFEIVGHALCGQDSAPLMSASKAFFKRPLHEKQDVARTADNPWGFFDQELTRNTPDWKEIYDVGPADGDALIPQWPAIDGFQHAIEQHYQSCESIAFDVLAAIAGLLGVSPKQLSNGFHPAHSSFLRLNYYPVCHEPVSPVGDVTAVDGYLGINPHTDSGALTILLQDQQPGLEIYRDEQWYSVQAGAVIVNIGDIVQVWSNDQYRAPLHRVAANAEKERFSAPFFFNPNYHMCYAPLESMVSAEQPARYSAIQWGEFRSKRAAGDFADYGSEVQISDYRTEFEY